MNKPSGLPVRGCDDCPCGLTDALPGLASRVGAKRVFYVRAPERFTSGVALLSTSEKGAEHLRRCLLRARGMKLFHDSYLAVTSGLPRLGGGGGGQAAEEVLDVLSKRCDVTTPVFGKYHVEVRREKGGKWESFHHFNNNNKLIIIIIIIIIVIVTALLSVSP